MNDLYQITLSYGCFGIEVDSSEKIFNTAPMGHWMLGKKLYEIKKWVEKKNGSIIKVNYK